MNSKILKLLLTLLILPACGFKIVDRNEIFKNQNFEIKSFGDGKINYKIKNKLNSYSKKEGEKVFINITTKKEKNEKERNIKNEITKYSLNISSSVVLRFENSEKKHNFKIHKVGEFEAASRHSETLNNEKKLVDILINPIIDEIEENISKIINDN